jgi:hypothetical protein
MSVLDERDECLPADFDVASEWVPELPMRRRCTPIMASDRIMFLKSPRWISVDKLSQ